jgi:hypothetical protein
MNFRASSTNKYSIESSAPDLNKTEPHHHHALPQREFSSSFDLLSPACSQEFQKYNSASDSLKTFGNAYIKY